MTNGSAKTKTNETPRSQSKRTSPHKDRTRKPKNAITEKKGPCKLNNTTPAVDNSHTSKVLEMEDELLTPQSILQSYECSKNGILEKLANSIASVEERVTVPIDVPLKQQQQQPLKNNPQYSSPKKCNSASERFAGLSNSPSPNSLPLPSFNFIDQELNFGATKDVPSNDRNLNQEPHKPSPPTKQMPSPPASPLPTIPPTTVTPQPVRSLPLGHNISAPAPTVSTPQPRKTRNSVYKNRKYHSAEFQTTIQTTGSLPVPVQPPTRTLNHSPPSNPHLDELSSQLRMMLKIGSVQS